MVCFLALTACLNGSLTLGFTAVSFCVALMYFLALKAGPLHWVLVIDTLSNLGISKN